MEPRLVLAPLFGMGLAGLVVLAFSIGRRDALASAARLPLAWFALLAVGLMLVASGALTGEPLAWVSGETVCKAGALLLVVMAAGLALLGGRARARAVTLVGSAPVAVDEAVAALRQGRPVGWGVYRGRLGATQTLTSPGGVACAFYDAEVRAVMPDGSRGPLLSTEKGCSEFVLLRGERTEVPVCVDARAVMAPVRIHRCEEAHPLEALSWERVGRLGEPCLVVGELRPGPAQGSYVLRGAKGGPAMLVLGGEALGSGEVLARRAWRMFAAAGALSAAAVLVLARSF
ncbi:hypothetical protein P2318_17820 [Myxococcaceae bacterium GXIMD 01537]